MEKNEHLFQVMPKLQPYEGIYPLHKPRGISSAKFLLDYVRQNNIPKNVKAGYAGTLDMLAEGLLIVAVGRKFTKQLQELSDSDKEYTTTINLSGWTISADMEHPVQTQGIKQSEPSFERVLEVLDDFHGSYMQYPPQYSAKRVNGERAYMAAREGTTIDLKPCQVTINSIELLDYEFPRLEILVSCSKGTFIRSLAVDIGKKLTGGAYVERLARTKVGDYEL